MTAQIRPSEALRAAQRHLSAAYAVQSPGLTMPQLAVLEALEGVKPRPLRQVEITALTGIDRSTLADTVSRLSHQGLIVRIRNMDNKRESLVSATPAGLKALRNATGALSQAEASMLGRVPAPDRPAFLRGLRAM
jgi:DNA-binding MarR family transcriptional regulator